MYWFGPDEHEQPTHLLKYACSVVAWVGVGSVKGRKFDYTLFKKVRSFVAWIGLGLINTSSQHTS